MVEQSEANTGVPVQEAMGDAAYGDGGRPCRRGPHPDCPGAGTAHRQRFPKNDFVIDLVAGSWSGRAGGAGRRTDAAHPCRPVRRVRMYDMSPAVSVHLGQGQEGTAGADPSPGGSPATGPCVATERRV